MTERVLPQTSDSKADRQARLAEQLRANLHRRKAQARALAAPTLGEQPAPDAPKTNLPK
jgi:hypothetical protein